jgi:hypothetical protein
MHALLINDLETRIKEKQSQPGAIILQQYFSWIENKITKSMQLVS